MLGRTWLALITSLFGITMLDTHFDANGQPQLPGPFPGLGAYSNVIKLSCGKQGASGERWNPRELPFIGCFGLSIGNSVSGTLAGRQVEFAVDAKGEENCKVDGLTVGKVVHTVGQKTNVPNVFGTCSNLLLCSDEDGRDCSSSVDVISHNSDKSVFFQINQRIFGHTFLTNQENWDDVQQRIQRCGEKTPWC